MKRLPVFALLLVLASVVVAGSQTTTSPAAQKPAVSTAAGPAKVAVVAFQAAVTQTNEFQRDFADLQKKYDPKRAQLKKLSDEIDTLTKQLQAQGAQLTDSERASRSRAIDEKKRQLDRDTQDAQTDFENDAQQLLNTLAGKVGAVMTDLAAKLGFTLVLDTGDQQNPMVLYAISSIDITKAVIEAYNLKSGVPAPPEQGAGQPAMDAPQPMPAPAH
jgi:outer membrane protein